MAESHYLVVQPFDPDDDTDRFDVEHPADCPTASIYSGDTWEYSCAVGFHENEYGIGEFFRHADDPAPFAPWLPEVPAGRHAIEAWHEERRYAQGTERDSGLRLAATTEGADRG